MTEKNAWFNPLNLKKRRGIAIISVIPRATINTKLASSRPMFRSCFSRRQPWINFRWCLLAIFTNNQRFQVAFAALRLLYQVSWILRLYHWVFLRIRPR